MLVLEVRKRKLDKMIPVKHDPMIGKFPSTIADPSLCDSILPRTSVSAEPWLDTHCLGESHQLGTEDRVAVEYQIIWLSIKGQCLTQLLNHLCSRRVKGRPTPLLNMRGHLLTESDVLDNQVSARTDNRP